MSKSIVGEAFGSEFVEFRRLRSILYYISMTEWISYTCIICCAFVLFLFIGLRRQTAEFLLIVVSTRHFIGIPPLLLL